MDPPNPPTDAAPRSTTEPSDGWPGDVRALSETLGAELEGEVVSTGEAAPSTPPTPRTTVKSRSGWCGPAPSRTSCAPSRSAVSATFRS